MYSVYFNVVYIFFKILSRTFRFCDFFLLHLLDSVFINSKLNTDVFTQGVCSEPLSSTFVFAAACNFI
jgi:hypothetical protein